MFGNLIKYERLNQNLKQTVLAKGICTPSYLSKIENNQIDPNEEILEMLLNKLKINVTSKEDLSKRYEEVYNDVVLSFKEAIINKNSSTFISSLDTYKNFALKIKNQDLYIMIQLMMFRLSLMNDDIKFNGENLKLIHKHFSKREAFIFNVCEGIENYQNNDSRGALKSFRKSEELLAGLNISEWELADFKYMYALVSFSTFNTFQAKELLSYSLSYFRNHLHFKRLIDCYVLEGLILKRGGELKQAIHSFNLAFNIANEFDYEDDLGMILHNIGHIYSLQEDYTSSKSYYMRSLEYKSSIDSKLITILNLCEDNFKYLNFENLNFWSQRGLELLPESIESTYYTSFQLQLYIYEALSKNDSKSLNLLKKGVLFFETNKLYAESYKFSLILGKTFYDIGKYKQSAYYYDKCLKFHLKINTSLI